LQHLVIEIDDVEADHDIRAGELPHQISDLISEKIRYCPSAVL